MSLQIETWLPSVISVGALSLVWYNFKSKLEDHKKEITTMKTETKSFLTEATHGILCENASLRIREHVSIEVSKLKKDVVMELHDIKLLINKNNDTD